MVHTELTLLVFLFATLCKEEKIRFSLINFPITNVV